MSNNPERRGFRRAVGAVTLVALGYVGAHVVKEADFNLPEFHIDNPFTSDTEPANKQFAEANQDCANEEVENMTKELSGTPIPEGLTIGEYEKQQNSRLAAAVIDCTTERSGIPAGTEGYEVQLPTIDVTADVVADRG